MLANVRLEGQKPLSVSIIKPTLNEAEGIERTVKDLLKALAKRGYAYEILVIDGGSTDGTVEKATKLGAKVIIERRKGYGRAYKVGFRYAKGDIIATLDGDGSYPSAHIPHLIDFLSEKRLDFITVNRFKLMEEGAMSLMNKIGNLVLSLFTKLLFGIKIEDSQSGMWIFRRKHLNHIMPISNGMPFSEEIKIRAFLHLNSCIEVAAPYYKRVGRPKLKAIIDGVENLSHLFRLFTLRMCGRV